MEEIWAEIHQKQPQPKVVFSVFIHTELIEIFHQKSSNKNYLPFVERDPVIFPCKKIHWWLSLSTCKKILSLGAFFLLQEFIEPEIPTDARRTLKASSFNFHKWAKGLQRGATWNKTIIFHTGLSSSLCFAPVLGRTRNKYCKPYTGSTPW